MNNTVSTSQKIKSAVTAAAQTVTQITPSVIDYYNRLILDPNVYHLVRNAKLMANNIGKAIQFNSPDNKQKQFDVPNVTDALVKEVIESVLFYKIIIEDGTEKVIVKLGKGKPDIYGFYQKHRFVCIDTSKRNYMTRKHYNETEMLKQLKELEFKDDPHVKFNICNPNPKAISLNRFISIIKVLVAFDNNSLNIDYYLQESKQLDGNHCDKSHMYRIKIDSNKSHVSNERFMNAELVGHYLNDKHKNSINSLNSLLQTPEFKSIRSKIVERCGSDFKISLSANDTIAFNIIDEASEYLKGTLKGFFNPIEMLESYIDLTTMYQRPYESDVFMFGVLGIAEEYYEISAGLVDNIVRYPNEDISKYVNVAVML